MTKTFCDLCGHEITAAIGGFQLMRNRKQPTLATTNDICDKCYDILWDCAAELKTGRKYDQPAIDKTTDHR